VVKKRGRRRGRIDDDAPAWAKALLKSNEN
jgi:hypothetical protein